MVQAAVLDGLVFDASPFSQDGFAAPEVDISWGEVADALVVAVGVVVVDEGRDGGFKLSFECPWANPAAEARDSADCKGGGHAPEGLWGQARALA